MNERPAAMNKRPAAQGEAAGQPIGRRRGRLAPHLVGRVGVGAGAKQQLDNMVVYERRAVERRLLQLWPGIAP